MSDQPADDTEEASSDPSTALSDISELTQASSTYKVLGEFNDPSGAGVLGRNTASSGTPIGVEGAVPNASGGYGLVTPHNAKIEGTTELTTIDTTASDFTVEAGTESTNDAQNIVLGHSRNYALDSVVGATIGGGGYSDGTTDERNKVTDHYGTVAGGRDNQVGNQDSDLSDVAYATIGGGRGNLVTGEGGTVPGGISNEAVGATSFAAGRQADAQHDGSFVWADRTQREFETTGDNQFIVEAQGGIGLGTNSPRTQLHVIGSASGANTATLDNHVATIENTYGGGDEDVLALKVSETGTLESWNHFITFFDGDETTVGAIEGDGSGGVHFTGTSADFAEFMPRLDPAEEIEPADIVGVVGNAVTKRTADADQALVVSDQSIVTGNSPGTDSKDRAAYESCAFIGQVPVKVQGAVEEGDLIVPSGEHDGTGQAIPPADYRPGDGPIVGRAWESNDTKGVSEVTVSVGLETSEALAPTLASQQETIEELEAENEALRDDLTDLEAETERKEACINELEQRVASLEDQMAGLGEDAEAPAATADD